MSNTKEITTLQLNNIGKRYNREWIFRHINYNFEAGKKYAITGNNGSGKSTLLKVIAGAVLHNEGSIIINSESSTINNQPIFPSHQTTSLAAPYLELIEEMTANEFLNFHQSFKPMQHTNAEMLAIIDLQQAANKQIRYYSSGMKQRLKLAQAFFSTTSILLLDEPTTNLDEVGIALYQHLIKNYTANKITIICSNDKNEYSFCDEVITIADYK